MAGFLDDFYTDTSADGRRSRLAEDPGISGTPRLDALLGGTQIGAGENVVEPRDRYSRRVSTSTWRFVRRRLSSEHPEFGAPRPSHWTTRSSAPVEPVCSRCNCRGPSAPGSSRGCSGDTVGESLELGGQIMIEPKPQGGNNAGALQHGEDRNRFRYGAGDSDIVERQPFDSLGDHSGNFLVGVRDLFCGHALTDASISGAE